MSDRITFSEWRRRTIANWRWWVVVPLVPVVVGMVAMRWLFRLPLFALDNAEQVSRAIFKWSRKGWKA